MRNVLAVKWETLAQINHAAMEQACPEAAWSWGCSETQASKFDSSLWS